MTTLTEIEESLRAALPPPHQARARELAHLIVSAIQAPAGRLPQHATADVRAALAALAGQELPTPQALISFGEGNQLGDITIQGDIAGRDVIRLSLAIAAASQLTPHEQRNRRAMLRKVRTTWIGSLPNPESGGLSWIDLPLHETPFATRRALQDQYNEIGEPIREVAPHTPIDDLFDRAGGSLLILGAPGTGKTTLLIALCRALLDRAEADEVHPIPAILNLSSWSGRHGSLTRWMVEELRARYDVPTATAETWVGQGAILPLLDGLDEATPDQRAACIEAINRSFEDQIWSIAVCARTQEYLALPTRLAFQGAVTIAPLTESRVDQVLGQAGAAFAQLRDLLRADAELRTIATTPLMLNVLARTATDAAALRADAPTPAIRRAQIVQTYLLQMFARREALGHNAGRSLHTLRWLARGLRAQGRPVLLLDQMEHDWLPASAWVTRYAGIDRVGAGVLIGLAAAAIMALISLALGDALGPGFWGIETGLCIALAVGMFGGGDDHDDAAGARYATRAALGAIVLGVGVGAAVGLLAALAVILGAQAGDWNYGLSVGINEARSIGIFGVLVGLLAGAPRLGPRRVGVIEARDWSWRRAWRFMGVGFGIGLIGGALDQIVLQLFGGLMAGSRPQDILAESLAVALLGALLGGLMGGPVTGKVEAHAYPNQGVWRSARSAAAAALVSALVCGGGSWLMNLALGDAAQTSFLMRSAQYALVGGVIGGCAYGGYAVISHLALRITIALSGSAPLNLVAFMDEACERVLLQREGNGYVFKYRMLFDHIVDLGDADLEQLGQAITARAGRRSARA